MRQLKLNGIGSLIILVFSFSSFSCVQKKEIKIPSAKSKINSDIASSYPAEIIDRKIERQYDLVKWRLFCVYCDNPVRFISSSGLKTELTFGSLDLKYAGLYQANDTTEIYFDFYFEDTIKCVNTILENPPIATGAGFLSGTDSISYFTSSSTMNRFWTNDPGSRFSSPIQKEVVEYLKKNKQSVNTWFYNESKRRGLVN
jgi:hypothetical protein